MSERKQRELMTTLLDEVLPRCQNALDAAAVIRNLVARVEASFPGAAVRIEGATGGCRCIDVFHALIKLRYMPAVQQNSSVLWALERAIVGNSIHSKADAKRLGVKTSRQAVQRAMREERS